MKKASVCVFSRDQGVIRCGVIWFQSGVDPALIGVYLKLTNEMLQRVQSLLASLKLSFIEWAW